MGFQKCPICDGTGKQSNTLSSASYVKCKTCDGYGIINELTGLPPKVSSRGNILVDQFEKKDKDNYNNLRDNTDFRDRPMESQQEYFGK